MEKTQVRKRIESFVWRLGMVTGTFAFAWMAENAQLLELPPAVTMVIGLMAGEVSKYLNTRGK